MLSIILLVLGTFVWFFSSTFMIRKIPSKVPNNIHGWGNAIIEDVYRYRNIDISVSTGAMIVVLSGLYNIIISMFALDLIYVIMVLILIFVVMVLVGWIIRSIRYWLKYKWLLDNSENKLAGDTGEYYKNHTIQLFFDVFICKNKK